MVRYMRSGAAFACAWLGLFAAGAQGGEVNRPRFEVRRPPASSLARLPAATLPNWTYSFTYNGRNYSDAFVGTNPSTGASTTVPVYIIPVKLTYGTTSFSPLSTLSNGQTVVQNTISSPVFSSNVDFKAGSVDLGTTQYVDAYQRGNLWSTVQSHPGYHVLLGSPTVESLQSLTVPTNKGRVTTDFGTRVIEADINWFDTQAIRIIGRLGIPANALPVFITTQTYLTDNGCCIGGYHSETTGGVTYAHFTYIQTPGAFAQDVSALSHEIGEWQLDPFVNNNSPCGIMENGDPLENEANYGDYAYTVNGFTYHLQDLVYLRYFGAPSTTSVNSWWTFQNTVLSVCQNGS
jgi:hypothetical protein